MASPIVGRRAGPCPQCGSAEVYLRVDAAPQCRDCKWTGVPQFDSKYLQSWSTLHIPADRSPASETGRQVPPEARRSGAMILAGAVVCIASIPLEFLLLRYVVGLLPWVDVSWERLVSSLQLLVVVGMVLQIVYGVVGVLGAGQAFRGNAGAGPILALFGLAAIASSLLLFGGIVGAVGGGLILGGAVQMRKLAEAWPGGLPA